MRPGVRAVELVLCWLLFWAPLAVALLWALLIMIVAGDVRSLVLLGGAVGAYFGMWGGIALHRRVLQRRASTASTASDGELETPAWADEPQWAVSRD